jgi:uncharacterized FlaG/YvyC family protein
MDAGISIRPVSGVVAADYARPASVPVQQAVTTDLDPSQAVTAASETATIRNDALSAQDGVAPQTTQTPQPTLSGQDLLAAQDADSQTILIDPATREVVQRVVDTRTQQVIRQVPDQALLRMRAYAMALQRGDSSNQAEQLADMAV